LFEDERLGNESEGVMDLSDYEAGESSVLDLILLAGRDGKNTIGCGKRSRSVNREEYCCLES